MTHALLLNLAILAATVILTFVTHNPLCLAGLLALRDMPYGLLVQPEPPPEESPRIGFTA
ncbi:hypothetical protein N5B55_05030 [Ralstonia pickettii]|uniref:hypothetical protein n=1 Tax=Ralstonia pickettii TaxID=329 RepID=UPI00271521A8|nr:hypothetical protein [Ralstonia pickettii]WKZ86318.1 hypothetical protein N5B55_05030 [Ralstonia pickettii]